MKKIAVLSVYLIAIFLMVACNDGAILYVSPSGNDANIGTKEQPLSSFEGAKNLVQQILQDKPAQKITVYFADGIYPLEHAVKFSTKDSGSEKAIITYKAADGAQPVFTGSKALTQWTIPDAKDLERLQPEVRSKIYAADLKVAGITDFGDATDAGKRPELICNGQLQPLARWPNQGFVLAGKSKGATLLPETYIAKHGTKEGVFEYLDSYQDRWAQEEDVRLGGYWYWDWSDEFQKADRWDAAGHTAYLREPFHRYGYKDSLRYFGLNLFCEIDQPGEWYLNRNTGILYWYPPEGIDPTHSEVLFTCFSKAYMLDITECSYLTFDGLSFRDGRGSAVIITEEETRNINTGNNAYSQHPYAPKGKGILLKDCRIERFGLDGIHIYGGTEHGVSGCYLSCFGHGGIKIAGGDRTMLTPCKHFVENTVIEHFSLFQRTYEPAVRLSGCGMTIANNCFSHSSSSAMRLEGNDFTIEYNEVCQVVNESDDQGGIDMWYNPSYRGTVIRYNRWADIKGGTRHGAAAIRFDDMISGTLVYGNIFERCGAVHFGGVQIHGGKDNRIENNVFYKCLAAVSFSPWGEERWLKELDQPIIKRKIYEDVDIRSEPYLQKYPELKNDIRQNSDANIVTDNLIISCDQLYCNLNDRQIIHNNTELDTDGKSLETFCTDAELAKHGLKPIPVEKIGVKNNKWKH